MYLTTLEIVDNIKRNNSDIVIITIVYQDPMVLSSFKFAPITSVYFCEQCLDKLIENNDKAIKSSKW